MFALLGVLGVFSLAGWAGRIIWQKTQEDYLASIEAKVKTTIDQAEKASESPVNQLSSNVTNMSKTLVSTFESQVDSATFKILRFGCSPKGTTVGNRVPACTAVADPANVFQAVEDQTILFVANPAKQIVRLDIALAPIDRLEILEPLLLQLYAEPPPMRDDGSGSAGRGPLLLKATDLIDEASGRGVLQDGRLRLATSGLPMQVSINLTSALAERNLAGPIRLRFVVMKEAPGSGGASGAPAAGAASATSYVQASGQSIFFLRTITSAHHRIPLVPAGKK